MVEENEEHKQLAHDHYWQNKPRFQARGESA
jgi:hypothetical protein